MLRLTEVASQSESFVKPTLRKAKTKTSFVTNCLIATLPAIRSKCFLLTGRLYWLLGNVLESLRHLYTVRFTLHIASRVVPLTVLFVKRCSHHGFPLRKNISWTFWRAVVPSRPSRARRR